MIYERVFGNARRLIRRFPFARGYTPDLECGFCVVCLRVRRGWRERRVICTSCIQLLKDGTGPETEEARVPDNWDSEVTSRRRVSAESPIEHDHHRNPRSRDGLSILGGSARCELSHIYPGFHPKFCGRLPRGGFLHLRRGMARWSSFKLSSRWVGARFRWGSPVTSVPVGRRFWSRGNCCILEEKRVSNENVPVERRFWSRGNCYISVENEFQTKAFRLKGVFDHVEIIVFQRKTSLKLKLFGWKAFLITWKLLNFSGKRVSN